VGELKTLPRSLAVFGEEKGVSWEGVGTRKRHKGAAGGAGKGDERNKKRAGSGKGAHLKILHPHAGVLRKIQFQ